VTVDKQLLGYRGRCPFKQYMPKKPSKYGIESWMLCDSINTYVWNIQIYLGKAPEKNQSQLDLCTTDLKDRNVIFDNFFTSYELGQLLLKRNMTMTRTILKNKTSIPHILLVVFSSTFAFTENYFNITFKKIFFF